MLYLAALATNSINTYLLTYLLTRNHIKSCAGVTSATSIKMNIYNARGSRTRSKQAVWEAATICHQPCKLTFDLLNLRVVSESRVTWATSVSILVFLGLSVLDFYGPIVATDIRRASSLNAPYPRGGA